MVRRNFVMTHHIDAIANGDRSSEVALDQTVHNEEEQMSYCP